MDADKARSIALSEMRRWGLIDKGWKFSFANSRTALGRCNPRKTSITLSTYYLDKVPETQILDTIRHEIAHALEFVRHGTSGHGPVWKRIAVEVGATPKARYTKKVNHPYPYVIKYEDKVVRGLWRLPPNISEQLPTMAIKGRPETVGKLKLFRVTYDR